MIIQYITLMTTSNLHRVENANESSQATRHAPKGIRQVLVLLVSLSKELETGIAVVSRQAQQTESYDTMLVLPGTASDRFAGCFRVATHIVVRV
jgi:hypothetical protein